VIKKEVIIVKKNRKKGSLIIEFLIIIPVFLLLAWGTIHIMFYVMAQSTLHQAAMDAARVTASELRGHQGEITTSSNDTQSIIEDKIKMKVRHITEYNAMLLLFRGEDYEHLEDSEVPLVIEPNDKCEDAMSSTSIPSVICIYTQSKDASIDPSVTVDQEQIIVKIKSKFRVFGSMIPGLKGNLYARGTGSSIKEQSNRFHYITP
jgi:uncharacterized protein (UPF0333 family)